MIKPRMTEPMSILMCICFLIYLMLDSIILGPQ